MAPRTVGPGAAPESGWTTRASVLLSESGGLQRLDAGNRRQRFDGDAFGLSLCNLLGLGLILQRLSRALLAAARLGAQLLDLVVQFLDLAHEHADLLFELLHPHSHFGG